MIKIFNKKKTKIVTVETIFHVFHVHQFWWISLRIASGVKIKISRVFIVTRVILEWVSQNIIYLQQKKKLFPPLSNRQRKFLRLLQKWESKSSLINDSRSNNWFIAKVIFLAERKITFEYLKGIFNEKVFSSRPLCTRYTHTSLHDSITIIINYCNLCTAKNKTKCLMFRIQTINMCESEWKISRSMPAPRVCL